MIERGAPGSERHLSSRDRRLLWGCLLVAVLSLAIGFYLFPRVNPEASIQFKVDRRSSEPVARAMVDRLASLPAGSKHASNFTYDDETKVFLERTLGVEQANALLGGELHAWRWSHRWFRPLEKEEWRVEVATTGEVVGLEHLIEEEASGTELPQDSARVVAEHFLVAALALDLAKLEFLDAKSERHPHRVDHTFTWKVRGAEWAGSTDRREVRVQGGAIGAYREYLKVPDAWRRDYEKLRSHNDGAAAVAAAFLFLTVGAAVVVLLQRLRLGDVRWNTAATFAGIGVVLTILASLNSFPSDLYDYDTTESFAGFLSTRIFGDILRGFAVGVFILIVVGAGEALYREAYPTKMSVTNFFSRRGLRTRRFLLSSLLGLTLTCFFFAYQELFYTVAKSLGAWAPMEVPYTELFNTAFPWIFVLLIGFLPAVTEESMSRMFSIPLVARFVRTPGVAIVLPALIWGFAHSNYPNQPFYIRGVEVSLAGILIGWLMVRVNIGTTLIWHFTVDALYTSVLLYGSKNLYYIVSATLAGCVMLLPIGYAVVSYLRSGHFEEPDGLLNSDEGPVLLPTPSPPIEPVFNLPTRWSGGARAVTTVAVLASLLLLLLPSAKLDGGADLRIPRTEVFDQARYQLRRIGEEPDSFRVLLATDSALEAAAGRYVLQHGGIDRLNEISARYSLLFRWRARYYQPLSPREVWVDLDPKQGHLVALDRSLAEAESLPSLDSDQARAVALGFLRECGVDSTGLDLAESSTENRPKRLDHTFIWEAREGDPRNVGEARHRVKVVVQGSRVGSYESWLKLPEHWVREHERRDLAWVGRLLAMVLVSGGLMGLVIWRLVQGHRRGETRWARCMIAALPVGVIGLLASLNAWPKVLANYNTSIPANVFMVTAVVGVVLGFVVSVLLSAVALAAATTYFPSALALWHSRPRRLLLRDAALAALLTLAGALTLDHLEGVLLKQWPAYVPVMATSMVAPLMTVQPWFEIVAHAIRLTVFALGLVGGLIGIARDERERPWLVALGLVATALAMVPLHAHGAGEVGAAFLVSLLDLVGAALLVRFVLRDNVLAYPLAIYLVFALQGVWPFLTASGPEFRTQGMIAAALLALPLLGLVLGGRGKDPRAT
ncbi:MAG: CPBP family intramembrane glutamic endopeptidase [Candidatus Eisenbacteria bacterium]